MNEREDTKRVAKNTLILYGRMMVMTLIGLYTSRIILQVLGIDNYGINNVVGGFLSMFTIISTTMTSAVSRFVTIELGHDNHIRQRQVFATTVNIMILLGIIMVVLIESFGLWFLNHELNIPEDRLWAANWVLHFAAAGTFITLYMVPYNASIIAHEKMSAFAYLSILDAIFKLVICFIVYVSPCDKLITYAAFGFITSILMEILYWAYCKRNFKECRYNFKIQKEILKDILSFATWNFFGQASWILNTQGINMLINIFFGVSFNAARGIAEQVNQKINQFVSGFMVSLTPQITKSYAAGNKDYAFKLACRGSRFSFYIMYVLALPIMLESKQILRLWLVTPPQLADVFVIWTILSTLIIILGSTLVTLQFAHGNIKKYEIIMTTIGSIPFPIVWLLFKLGAPVHTAYWVFIVSYWFLIFIRFWLVHESTGIPTKMYLGGVIMRCHAIGLISAIIPTIFVCILSPSTPRLICTCIISIVVSCICIYHWGIEQEERKLILNEIKKRIQK